MFFAQQTKWMYERGLDFNDQFAQINSPYVYFLISTFHQCSISTFAERNIQMIFACQMFKRHIIQLISIR